MNSCLKAYESTQNSSSLMKLWSTAEEHTDFWLHAFVNNTQSIKFKINSWVLYYFFENLVCLKNSQTISSQKTGLPYIRIFKEEILWFIDNFPALQYSIQLIHKEDMGKGPMCNGNATQLLEVGWLQLLEFCFNDPVLITLLSSQCADAWEDCNIFLHPAGTDEANWARHL